MKNKLFLSLLFIISALILANVAYADTIDISIPYTSNNENPIDIIAGFYKFALAISGILAVAVILYGAIKYMASPGSAGGQSDAKEWITSALLGILLLAGAYLILNTINPELTILRLPGLKEIEVSTTTAPSLTSVYAVVEKVVKQSQFYENEQACKVDCKASNQACVKHPDDPNRWACAQNTPMPNNECSKDLSGCISKKNQLSQQNPTKYYDCVRVDSDRTTWCSSKALEPVPTGEKCATGNCVKIDFAGWIIKNGSLVDKKMYDVLSCIAGSGYPLRVTEAMPPTVIHQSVRHNNGCAIDATLQIVQTKADCSKLAELQSTATACGAARFLNEYVNLCKGTPYEGTKTEGGNADHVHIEASCGR